METERLLINSLTEEDKYDYFHNISNDKKVLETFICNYEDNIEAFDFSKMIGRNDILAIRLKETKKLIGILVSFNSSDSEAEIGYGIGRVYWNNGYTTEAVKCFMNHLFNNGINKIYASFFEGNLASKRVMEKCGMQYSHTNYNELEYLGMPRNLVYYVIEK